MSFTASSVAKRIDAMSAISLLGDTKRLTMK